MRRLLFVVVTVSLSLFVAAQSNGKESSPTAFKKGGKITLLGGQTGRRNWAPAGEEKFSLTAYGNLLLCVGQ